jgi:hypothetical protein
MLSFSISYGDIIKFLYFATITESEDSGGESRPKDSMTLPITLWSQKGYHLKGISSNSPEHLKQGV